VKIPAASSARPFLPDKPGRKVAFIVLSKDRGLRFLLFFLYDVVPFPPRDLIAVGFLVCYLRVRISALVLVVVVAGIPTEFFLEFLLFAPGMMKLVSRALPVPGRSALLYINARCLLFFFSWSFSVPRHRTGGSMYPR